MRDGHRHGQTESQAHTVHAHHRARSHGGGRATVIDGKRVNPRAHMDTDMERTDGVSRDVYTLTHVPQSDTRDGDTHTQMHRSGEDQKDREADV